jgi:beta-glucosidase
MQGSTLASDHSVVAEPKHFAGHGSPEGGLNTAPVHAGEREVRSVFLRSFQPAVEWAGARGIMAAYHEIDGVPCTANPWLLNNVLRGEWGFKGFVLSDLGAIDMLHSVHHVAATEADAVRLAIKSGVDMQFYDFGHDTFQNALIDGVAKGALSVADLDRAVSHVLRVKFELGLFDHPYIDPDLHPKVSRNADHLATSLRSSRESICLLKNAKGILPLPMNLETVAVIGPNATTARTGDYTETYNLHPVSLREGIQSLLGSKTKVIASDGADVGHAVELAKLANVVVMGLGERNGISGEGSDRSSLNLPDNQEELLEAVVATGKPVVLVLENGRPLALSWAAHHVDAIIEAWYPGEFGGRALAETIFGLNNPAGRLPISFPESVGVIPNFYAHDPSKGDHYVDGSAKPVWPFGFGLSYTSFTYSDLRIQSNKNGFEVTCTVANTGKRQGDEVVQLYERADTSSVATPVRSLKGFRRIRLSPSQSASVKFELGRYELEVWGSERKWRVEPGSYQVWAGGSSEATLEGRFTVSRQQIWR